MDGRAAMRLYPGIGGGAVGGGGRSGGGVTERSANRLRARGNARSFAKAWAIALALREPVREAARPWRWRLHRWRGRMVHRERVWDDRAVLRVLARSDPYRYDLSYRGGEGPGKQGVTVRTFADEHRRRERLAAERAAAGRQAAAGPVARDAARAAWAGASLQMAGHSVFSAFPHRSRQGRPSRSRPPHGWSGAPVARTTGPPLAEACRSLGRPPRVRPTDPARPEHPWRPQLRAHPRPRT